jgi:hypothetical protein
MLASNTLDGISKLYCSICDQYEPQIDYNIGCVFDITPYKLPSIQYFMNLSFHKMKGMVNVVYFKLPKARRDFGPEHHTK